MTLRREARARGMLSLVENGLEAAREGVTSLAELLRVLPYRLLARPRSDPSRDAARRSPSE